MPFELENNRINLYIVARVIAFLMMNAYTSDRLVVESRCYGEYVHTKLCIMLIKYGKSSRDIVNSGSSSAFVLNSNVLPISAIWLCGVLVSDIIIVFEIEIGRALCDRVQVNATSRIAGLFI